jgi:hypothetical protein
VQQEPSADNSLKVIISKHLKVINTYVPEAVIYNGRSILINSQHGFFTLKIVDPPFKKNIQWTEDT